MKPLGCVVLIAVILIISLLVSLAMWGLWGVVVPWFFPNAPSNIAHPPFLIFYAANTLINLMFSAYRRSKD